MPRPCKRRLVCSEPSCHHFGPLSGDSQVSEELIMTLDEFEALRLIDLEDRTQEQCAQQMNIARTTAQAIYNSARKKIAECLVLGKSLKIQGGHYIISGNQNTSIPCSNGCQHCRHNHNSVFKSIHGGISI